MTTCWKFLFRPKHPDETEEDKILRRLSFKLPIVVRYNFLFAFFFGFAHGLFAKRPSIILKYFMVTPIFMTLLCQ